MSQNQVPLVSICCLSYNHVSYIRQCLDGFIMQKTDFPFEVLLHDDASTDGTVDIIKEYENKYPSIIKPIYQTENQHSKGVKISATFNYPRAQGKYIAMCEGDDYWLDPLKLQKQVDFLEGYPQYGLVHTAIEYVDTKSNIIEPPTGLHKSFEKRIFNGYVFDYYLIHPGFIMTVSCIFRKCLLDFEAIRKLDFWYDHCLFMEIARKSLVYYLPEKTAAYRRNPQGAMATQTARLTLLHTHTLYYQLNQYLTDKEGNYKNNTLESKYRIHRRMGLATFSLLLRFLYLKDFVSVRKTVSLIRKKKSLVIWLPVSIPFLIWRYRKFLK